MALLQSEDVFNQLRGVEVLKLSVGGANRQTQLL